MIYGYLDNDKITQNCIIGDEFSSNKTRTNFSTSKEKNDNVNDNDLIFGDDKSKESLSSVLSPSMKSDVENDIFGFEIKIEKMSNPIIKANDVFLDIDNTSIHIEKKHSHTPEESYINDRNMPSNLHNDEDILLRNARYAEDAQTIEAKLNHYTNSFPNHQTVEGEDRILNNLNLYNDYDYTFRNYPFENNLYQINNYEITDPKKRNDEYSTYSNNPVEDETILPNTKKQDHNFKSEELRINDSNDPASKDKQTQLNTRLDFLQLSQRNSLNSPYYQHQCIPYTPQVGASLLQQSQLPPYPYDPNINFNSILPIPRTPSGSYPQYPYINPNYSPQLPSPYPIYPYNPYYVNQNIQNPTGQYYLCSPIPTSSGSSIANIPGIEVRANSIIDEPDEQLKYSNSNVLLKSRQTDLLHISATKLEFQENVR